MMAAISKADCDWRHAVIAMHSLILHVLFAVIASFPEFSEKVICLKYSSIC